MANPFMQYVMNDVIAEMGDQNQKVYEKVEPPFALVLIKAAELAGFNVLGQWEWPSYRTMNVIVQRP